ncbi:MAG TPA: histidinol-phosphate transaminase, partial [Treponema sp.]|nr:histidinol-phosphate transaminase [Treponema sp.]
EREKFTSFLQALGWDVVPSQTNFVFVKKNGIGGEEAYRKIKEHGILVRHFATNGIEDYLRITIGTAGQMQTLCTAMEHI